MSVENVRMVFNVKALKERFIPHKFSTGSRKYLLLITRWKSGAKML
jgi:hypothetical protein